MQHLTPDLVLPLSRSGRWPRSAIHCCRRSARDGRGRRAAGRRSPTTPAPAIPHAATPEKGARYFDAVADRLAGFYVELAAADPDHLYA